MERIYTHQKSRCTISSRITLPKKKGDYIYFVKLVPRTQDFKTTWKIGTTDRPIDRMKEHLRYYKYEFDIEVYWFSPCLSKYTTLRIEDRTKLLWQTFQDWEYIRNDRFLLPQEIKEVTIKIRKNYIIQI